MPEVAITSFGYLHGAPPAAEITLDLRAHFLDPHVNPALRTLTARDPEVVEAVLATAGVLPLIDAAAAAARAYLSGPSADEHPVRIAVGCAGGQHRAATVAEQLRDVLAMDGYDVAVKDRDLAKPVVER